MFNTKLKKILNLVKVISNFKIKIRLFDPACNFNCQWWKNWHIFIGFLHHHMTICYSTNASMAQLVKTSACNLKRLSLNTVGGIWIVTVTVVRIFKCFLYKIIVNFENL